MKSKIVSVEGRCKESREKCSHCCHVLKPSKEFYQDEEKQRHPYQSKASLTHSQ